MVIRTADLQAVLDAAQRGERSLAHAAELCLRAHEALKDRYRLMQPCRSLGGIDRLDMSQHRCDS